MFVNAIKKIETAVFPIFITKKLTSGQNTIGVAGTGFFVGPNGEFVTVAHIFDNADENTKFNYSGLIPTSIESKPLSIAEIVRDDSADIYVGKVDVKTVNFLELDEKIPEVGRSVCVVGYPLPELTAGPNGIDVGQVRRYYQPSFILDRAKIQGNSNGKIRTHEGFILRDLGMFGMSGGPVFDIEGKVVGMQASVLTPRVSTNGQRQISVENALAVGGYLISKILKDQEIIH